MNSQIDSVSIDSASPSAASAAALLAALESEASLSPIGQVGAQFEIQYCQDMVQRGGRFKPTAPRPDICVIGGLPRSGTTALHHILDSTGLFRCLTVIEALRPTLEAEVSESPSREALLRSKVQDYADLRMKSVEELSPSLLSVHPLARDGIEECTAILQAPLTSLQTAIMFRVPSYMASITKSDRQQMERFWIDQISLVLERWPSGSQPLLKSPVHIGAYKEFFDMLRQSDFVIQVRRDVVAWFVSFVELVCVGRKIFSDDVDPVRVAEEWLAVLPGICESATEACGEAVTPILTLDADHIRKDPLSATLSVVRRLGIDPTLVDPTKVVGAARAIEGAHVRKGLVLDDLGVSRSAILKAFSRSINGPLLSADAA